MEIIPLVVLTEILPSIIGAGLVVILLEAELSELSHCAVRADEPEDLFILAHVHVGAGVLIGSHVT